MDNEEGKLFSLKDAERTRGQVEPLLLEAMEARRRLADVEEKLARIAEQIQRSGGLQVRYGDAVKFRVERDTLAEAIQATLERIQATGCVVKDLDVGLLDFPARLNNEEVYFCWRVGEDRIRFYHRQDEGFAGRRPIDPRDASYPNPVQ